MSAPVRRFRTHQTLKLFRKKENRIMCFSQYTQYAQRPVAEESSIQVVRPAGAPPSRAETDPNLFGPIPTPPEWEVAADDAHMHDHTNAPTVNGAGGFAVQAVANGSSQIAGVSTQTLEAVVVELANGTKLLICPL
jgi:hypothetical protein